MGLVTLKKTLQRAPFPFLPCEDAAWRKIPNEQGPHQTVDSDGASILDLAVSRTVRKTFQLFTTPSPQPVYGIVGAAQKD